MRAIVDINLIENNKDLFIWFLMNGFPEGLDEETDMSLVEILEDEFDIDKEAINEFTGYYDGVFDDNDGYVDTPKSIRIELSEGVNLYIDFHPGAVEYYMENNKLGELGPEYDIKKISYEKFVELTASCSKIEKVLLLPMVYIPEDNKEAVISLLSQVLDGYGLGEAICNRITSCILSNCLQD